MRLDFFLVKQRISNSSIKRGDQQICINSIISHILMALAGDGNYWYAITTDTVDEEVYKEFLHMLFSRLSNEDCH